MDLLIADLDANVAAAAAAAAAAVAAPGPEGAAAGGVEGAIQNNTFSHRHSAGEPCHKHGEEKDGGDYTYREWAGLDNDNNTCGMDSWGDEISGKGPFN